MATIEERAKEYATIPAQIRGFGEDVPEEFDGEMYAEYIRIATEQDRIARAEERERCIKLAIKKHCQYCLENKTFEQCYNSDCDCCSEPYAIRKAIEEGGEG